MNDEKFPSKRSGAEEKTALLPSDPTIRPAVSFTAPGSGSDPFEVQAKGYKDAHSDGGSWVYVRKDLTLRDLSGYGWKLHIALAGDQSNVQTAWDKVIRPILIEYRVKQFKIAKLRSLSTAASKGTVCTIYLYDEKHFETPEFNSANRGCCARLFSYWNGHAQFIAMLQAIENGLAENEIQPAKRQAIDQPIQGSRFLSFRNDHGILRHADVTEDVAFDVPQVEKEYQAGRIFDKTNPVGDEDVYGLQSICLKPTPTTMVTNELADEKEPLNLN